MELFKIVTFGCKLNQAESEKISADLILAGFEPSHSRRHTRMAPDLVILNVCAVTHKAVREARQKVAQLRRRYPVAKIIVTGCIDENDWVGVDLWVKNQDKDKLSELLKKEIINWKPAHLGSESEIKQNIKILKYKNIKTNFSSRTRAFIKIQDGCDNFCAYCFVPFVRGKPRSRGVAEIIDEIQDKEDQGYREVVLTGVNIGLYTAKATNANKGRMEQLNSEIDLVELLKIILKETDISRIRLSSLWPAHLTSQLIDLMAKNFRICPHIHLSIQSGSDRILNLMGRNYTADDVFKITRRAREMIPNINFTGDLIAGFPGETEQDFQSSADIITRIGLAGVHVFTYSPRPGTKAARMENKISDKVKQTRSQTLIRLSARVAQKIRRDFLGKKFHVLWEERRAGFWSGWTENYIRVKREAGRRNLYNTAEEIVLRKSLLMD